METDEFLVNMMTPVTLNVQRHHYGASAAVFFASLDNLRRLSQAFCKRETNLLGVELRLSQYFEALISGD
jgi:hypothetical protein